MSTKYSLIYEDTRTIWKGTIYVNYLCGIGWMQDTAGEYLSNNCIYLKSEDQTDQAIILIGLGLSQEEIQEILNNG